MGSRVDAVVIGAGIAGVATAHSLTARAGISSVLLVDPRPPLSLTSDKSTECYRNFWPNLPMVQLMNRSIDLLTEYAELSGDAFGLTRRGYLFVTGSEGRLSELEAGARASSDFGSGPVRVHRSPASYGPADDGFDVLIGGDVLRHHFPYLSTHAIGALHVRRAGWFSAQQLGAWMLDEAREAGLRVVAESVRSISTVDGRINAVITSGGDEISTPIVVDAAGPMSPEVAAMAGVHLPIYSELHLKVGFKDHRTLFPRDAPLMIWSDRQTLDWSEDEREELRSQGRAELTGVMPEFCHGRPEGGIDSPYVLALWEYHGHRVDPVWPIPADDLYPEVVMRGMATMVPRLGAYLGGLPQHVVDGGYYSKTKENRPLVGPAGPEGFHLMAGMSGFGVMAACGAAELATAHITGAPLPGYADAFLLSRYDDPSYRSVLAGQAESGQL